VFEVAYQMWFPFVLWFSIIQLGFWRMNLVCTLYKIPEERDVLILLSFQFVKSLKLKCTFFFLSALGFKLGVLPLLGRRSTI
jgi:hypothetical protein